MRCSPSPPSRPSSAAPLLSTSKSGPRPLGTVLILLTIELLFEILSMQAMHLLVFVIINGLYFYIYSLNSAFFEQFKVERLPWPWQASPQKWLQLRRDTLVNFGLNFLLGVILAYLAGSLNSVSFRNDRDSLPSLPETLAHLAFCMVLEDLLFYTSHRLLHTPYLYRFHKQHHEYRVTGKARKHPSFSFGGILPPVGVCLGELGPLHHRAEAAGASNASTERVDAY